MNLFIKKFTLIALLVGQAFAGEIYLNCGKGNIDNMEEFISSSLVTKNKAMTTFQTQSIIYTVIFESNKFEILRSDSSLGGFTRIKANALGLFRESPLFDGFSCHLND